MNMEPLLEAPIAVQFHLATACAAAVSGAIVLARPKGTRWHRALGRGFVLTLGVAALSSFFIHETRSVGGFSAIHLLSMFVLVNLWRAVRAIRERRVRAHRQIMIATYLTGIVVAGGFTFLPGRLMARMTYGDGDRYIPVVWIVLGIAAAWFVVRFVRGRSADPARHDGAHGKSP